MILFGGVLYTQTGAMMEITNKVELDVLDPTLDQMQEFIDSAKALGISGNSKILVVGSSEGYHFTGTYKFTPKGLRVEGAPKKTRQKKDDTPKSEGDPGHWRQLPATAGPNSGKPWDVLCKTCGYRRGDHAATSALNDEHWCPAPEVPNGFSTVNFYQSPS